MPQVYLSASPVPPEGFSGTLPTSHSDGGSRQFRLVVKRDVGLLGADGTPDINNDAVIQVTQNGIEILRMENTNLGSLNASGVSVALLMPYPSGGPVTVTNLGPGQVNYVGVEEDLDDRGSVYNA